MGVKDGLVPIIDFVVIFSADFFFGDSVTTDFFIFEKKNDFSVNDDRVKVL